MVLGIFACKVTSKVLGIGAAERCWDDLKKIKPGKRSDISSDVSEKQSIVYISDKWTCLDRKSVV